MVTSMASEQPDASSAADGVPLELLTIDRGSPVPLYFQVAQYLERAIEDGRMPPGTRLDNEVLLAEQLGLSRPTLRRAMQHLVDKGMLVRRRGVGTRVVQPKVRRPLELTSLFDDLTTAGRRPTTKVLSNVVEPATPEIAAVLDLSEGADVIRITRLRSALDQPIAKMVNVLPGGIPGLTTPALEHYGLYQLLRAAGVQLHTATQTIGARRATAEEARALGETKGAALLTMQRLTYDDHGRPVELGTHVYAATRYTFELSLLTG
jgi:DNA-binding GntR family transcriptional regulator